MDGHAPLRSFSVYIVALAWGLVNVWASGARCADVPYTGVVVGEKVHVHAGAGQRYYVVGELKTGDLVNVDEVLFDWYKIVPPPGTASYVSKAFVDASGDGKIGQVNHDRTPVMAASLAGPGDSYRKQLDLMKGQTVQIVAEEGSFYKIVPPKGAYMYLAPGSVQRVGNQLPPVAPPPATTTKAPPVPPAAPGAPDTAPGATTPAKTGATQTTELVGPPLPPSAQQQGSTDPAKSVADAAANAAAQGADPALAPAGQPANTAAGPNSATEAANAGPTITPADNTAAAAGNTAAGNTAATAPAPAAAPRAVQGVNPEVRAAEQRMLAALDLPIEQRPIDELLTVYQSLSRRRDLAYSDHRIVTIRVAQLRRSGAAAAALKDLAAARRRLDESVAQSQAAADTAAAAKAAGPGAPGSPAVNYQAIGRLVASGVYNGKTLPLLLRVVEPNTFRTIAYVRPDNPDAAANLGRVVGIVGESRFDKAMQLNVVLPTRIDVLEAVATADTATP